MKKIFPYIFLIALFIPQLVWIGKYYRLINSKETISFVSEMTKNFSEEEDTESSENSESETESGSGSGPEQESESESESEKEIEAKKYLSENSYIIESWISGKSFERLSCRYINHYDFFYSSIIIPPPKAS